MYNRIKPGMVGTSNLNGVKTIISIPEPSFATQQEKVPARFQDCSGFSGRAFSCHQSLAPEIETQQIRCWELYSLYHHYQGKYDTFAPVN